MIEYYKINTFIAMFLISNRLYLNLYRIHVIYCPLQIYLQALCGAWHKTSPQQIQECSGLLSVLPQEKKKEGFEDKNAQASYDQAS